MRDGLEARVVPLSSRGTEGIQIGKNLSNYLKKGDKKLNCTTTKMLDLQAQYQEQFSSFWSKAFPKKKCPALPSKLDDLGLMAQVAMREEAPILFQNLFREDYSKIPCDTANRLRNGNLWIEDIEVLEQHGWTAKATEMRAQVAEAEKQILEKKIAEAKAKNDERDRKQQAYNQLSPEQKMALHPPSEASIAQARREWNITGEPTY